MKLHFEPNLDYQQDAIEAVCDLFRGRRSAGRNLPSSASEDPGVLFDTDAHGASDWASATGCNCWTTRCWPTCSDIQIRNGLRPSASLDLRRFHRRDGDRHRQDLRLPAHDLRAEPALRLHQVRDRRAVGGDQGRRLQDAPDHRGALPRPLRQHAVRVSSSTTPASSARCATSPPARTSRSWW